VGGSVEFKKFSSVDELMDDMMKPKPFYIEVWYNIRNFYDDWCPKSLYRKVDKLVRWYRWGFNPEDLWSLDYATAKFLLPRLKKFKETKHGSPSLLNDDESLQMAYEEEHGKLNFTKDEHGNMEYENLEKLWDFALQKMIDGFEESMNNDYHDDWDKHKKIIDDGLFYFSRYFTTLWD
tara:strand:- start:1380 stop:1913 length:534 start_codon:yes stop_codon:yes gene_type:complete